MSSWLHRVSWADAWYHASSRLLRTKPVGAMAHGGGDRDEDLTELAGDSPVGLAKVLTTLDLVSLGVGSCVGTGMYVVAGLVAKAVAGPGVILSFVIAAAASILSGVCYAEFGVRVPKTTGSAYTYSYVTVGEFVAFLIGWNLILEYLIGTAAGASALSSMFDSLANHSISHYMIAHLGTLRGLGKGEDTFPDLLAMFIVLLVTLIVALGVRNSVMQGAATCFYAFIGFDIIATTGEEAQNPNTSIPYAITASLVMCLSAYVSVSVILTLMVPYDLIDGSAPLMEMFAAHGFLWGKYTVAVGSIAGLSVSLLGSLFPMPRVIYAMATDGLLFRSLSHVSAFTHTPAAACVVSGTLASFLALLVSLRDLIEMMSIGTLLAYTLVSVCVLLLRYQPDHEESEGLPAKDRLDIDCSSIDDPSDGEGDHGDFHTGPASPLQRLLGAHYQTLRARLGVPAASARPTAWTGRTVTRCTLAFFFLSFLLWTAVIFGVERGAGTGAAIWGLTAALLAAALAALLLIVLRQPQSGRSLAYMAPCVPFVPAAAILVNSYLMLKLSPLTWARFAIWCAIGLLIYALYGVWHSSLEVSAREEEAHASSYQRFDDHLDETFAAPEDDEPYRGWAAPHEQDSRYQNHAYDEVAREDDDGGHFGYQRGGGSGGGSAEGEERPQF
ncbi:solute carrier family 7 member 14-like isoform X2 [Vanacampus margaritifer]